MQSTGVATLAGPTIECDERGCREATSHQVTCRCSCKGAGHAMGRQVAAVVAGSRFQSRADVRSGFTTAMLAATDDEAW